MTDKPSLEEREHDLTLHVFTISATMVGVCLTTIGIVRLISSQTRIETLSDELLAADAVIFMISSFLSFWSFKTRVSKLRRTLRLIIDAMFLVGLAVMVVICSVIAYAII
jgi:hypothetical protein